MAEFEKVPSAGIGSRANFREPVVIPNCSDAYQSLVILLIQRELDREAAVKVLNQMVAVNDGRS